jgi:hypothetical protein
LKADFVVAPPTPLSYAGEGWGISMMLRYDLEWRLIRLREAWRAWKRRRTSKRRNGIVTAIPESSATGIAIAAIVKDEGAYLAEWVEFHLMLGVRHIFFYDNGSTDNTPEVLAPYLKDNLVSILPWRNFAGPAQPLAFAHALANFGPNFRWMAFTDVDEFLFPVQGSSLDETMKTLEHLPAISLPWMMFGFSGHQIRPEGLVIKNFTERAAFPPIASQYTLLKHKSIVNPRAVYNDIGIHLFVTKQHGEVLINDRGQIYPHGKIRSLKHATADHLRLHHYFTRSHEEFHEKLLKGRVDKLGKVQMDVLDRRIGQYKRHTEQDTTIWRFIPELERRLAVRYGQSQSPIAAPRSQPQVAIPA